jgi:hypothetical protein
MTSKTTIEYIKNGADDICNIICNKLNITISLDEDNTSYIDKQYFLISLPKCNYDGNIKFKINLENPLKYYLVDEENDLSYEITCLLDFKRVLDELNGNIERECSNQKCYNKVNLNSDFPKKNRLCEKYSKYMLTSIGENIYYQRYFCSSECMDYYDKYNRCKRCHLDYLSEFYNEYIDELGYSLCVKRHCNYNKISCFDKYRLELRFIEDYKNEKIFYTLNNKIKNKLLGECYHLDKLLSANDNKLTNSMLLDLHNLYRYDEIRTREENEPTDENTFMDLCDGY